MRLRGATVRVHVRVTESGSPSAQPALFVHGLGGSALNWTDLAAALRGRLAIEAIDLPGHGHSPPPTDGKYSPDRFAATVIAYLENSGRGPVHLVGNSMGGAISLLVAARRPDLIRTLTLISPAVPDNRVRVYPLLNNPRMAVLIVPVLGEALARRFSRRVAADARVRGTLAICFADPDRYPQQRFDDAMAEESERATYGWAVSAYLRSMRGLARSQLLRGRAGWALMRSIRAPSLVIWGDRDRLVAPDLAPYVAAAIPQARLRVLPDIGHTAMMEDPASTARLILALVEDTDTADTSGEPAGSGDAAGPGEAGIPISEASDTPPTDPGTSEPRP